MVSGWVVLASRHAWLVVAASLLLTALSGWYTATHLTIDTDTDGMLSDTLDFRKNSIRLKQVFPQLSNNIAIVIDGDTAGLADDAALAIAKALRDRPRLFQHVFDPRGDPFLRQNGLLFLDEGKLGSLVDRLAASQVFLGKLSRDPSLRGLFDVLRLALKHADKTVPLANLTGVLDAVAKAVEAESTGARHVVPWSTLLDGGGPAAADPRRIILVKPALDFGSLAPAADAMAEIRQIARALGLTPETGIRVRLTGSAPLEHEELESVAEGMGLAGIVSLSLVLCLLLWGLKSPRLVVALLLTLIMGLVWTAAFAALAVGRLNLISVAFAVLFIGLSVDFGIHFALRVREEMATSNSVLAAMRPAAASVSGALWLCAIAAAIAFFSFLPTDYVGLAELGVIAGAGMFIALFANLTILPACMVIAPPGQRPRSEESANVKTRPSWRIRHARGIIGAALVIALGAAATTPHMRFDFDPLNLKDRSTESVRTLLDLMGNEDTAPYTADILAASAAEARTLTATLEALPTVDSVLSVERFLPRDQESKLPIIESAAFLILPALAAPKIAPPDDAGRAAAFVGFHDFLEKGMGGEGRVPAGLLAPVRRLDAALRRLSPAADTLRSLENRLLATFPGRLQALRESLEAGPVTLADLSPALRSRFVGASGQWRLEIFPEENVRVPENLDRFVAEIEKVAPSATGSPIIIVAAGQAIMKAFAVAATISVSLIALLIVILLRRARDVLLVFAPLALAALLTIAASVLLSLPFNFANVIVLPLLFGLGVASAIHLVVRERLSGDLLHVLRSTTPRAVIFSALTTIGSFASIALSSHPGTASMGVLLTIAIGLTLICTMVVLPALIALFSSAR
jgi:hopanoid biosynthesis associated RND transporter like protein HpnN